MKSYTIKDMNSIAQSHGGKCLSKMYKNAHHHLEWQCARGHVWKAKPASINLGVWCNKCSNINKLKYTLADLKLKASENGGQCLATNEVRSNRMPIPWRCRNQHTWMASPSVIMEKNSWCSICNGKNEKGYPSKRYDILEMQKIALARGGKCISKNYKGQSVKLKWECSQGHQFMNLPSHVVHRKQWCPTCAGKSKAPIASIRQLAQKRNGKLISKSYTNTKQKLKWECSKGHRWEARINDLRNGNWCPFCSKSSTSKKEIFFFSEFAFLFPQTIHRHKIKGFEIDIYVPELKTGIEIDGGHWHLSKLEKDLNKFKMLKDHGTNIFNVRGDKLLRVSSNDVYFKKHEKDYDVFVRLLQKMIRSSKISFVNKKILKKYIKLNKALNSERYMNELTKLPGPINGRSLADKFPLLALELSIKLNKKISAAEVSYGSHLELYWECKNGHKPYLLAVKSRTSGGRGCPQCGKDASIASRSNAVASFRGKILVKEYRSVQQAAKDLKLAPLTVRRLIASGKLTKSGLKLIFNKN